MGETIKKPDKCNNCGANIYNSESICLVCKGQAVIKKEREFKPVYAGFWLRLAAYIIDALIVGMVIEIYTALFGFNYYLSVLFYFSYKVFLEASKYQGTLGKGMMGIKVTNYEGKRITLNQSTMRYLGHLISFFLFFAGFIMIALTPKKQGVQDYIAQTLVIKN